MQPICLFVQKLVAKINKKIFILNQKEITSGRTLFGAFAFMGFSVNRDIRNYGQDLFSSGRMSLYVRLQLSRAVFVKIPIHFVSMQAAIGIEHILWSSSSSGYQMFWRISFFFFFFLRWPFYGKIYFPLSLGITCFQILWETCIRCSDFSLVKPLRFYII